MYLQNRKKKFLLRTEQYMQCHLGRGSYNDQIARSLKNVKLEIPQAYM